MTGMPSVIAFSTRLSVMPERGGAAVAVPVRLADDLVNAVALGPLRGEPLDARAAAMHQHHVGVGLRISRAGELWQFLT